MKLIQQSKPNADNSQWAILAGLRFALAATVVFYHSWVVFGQRYPFVQSCPAESAVVCFFLISGFSISHSVDKRPKGYIGRRMLRILPIYATCFILALAPYLFFNDMTTAGGVSFPVPSAWCIFYSAFMLQGVFGTAFLTFAPSWTLVIEEFYYLLAPRIFRLPVYVLVIYASASAIVFRFHFAGPKVQLVNWFLLGGFWVAGMILYRCRSWWATAFAASICIGAASGFNFMSTPQSYTMLLLTIAAIRFGSLATLPSMLIKALVYLGDISFPLYLSHFAVMVFLYQIVDRLSGPGVYAVATLGVSAAIYHLVDVPIRKRKKSAPQLIAALTSV